MKRILPLSVLLLTVAVVGCYKPPEATEADKKAAATKHSGWWCDEHGVPEADCSLCLPDAEVKKRFKDAGDWCEKHNRARSQCFICEPELQKKFARLYKEKYGKEPPAPTE